MELVKAILGVIGAGLALYLTPFLAFTSHIWLKWLTA